MGLHNAFVSEAARIRFQAVLPDGTIVPLGDARPREFSTGSCGWNLSAKVQLDGYAVQLGLNAIVQGSKPESAAKLAEKADKARDRLADAQARADLARDRLRAAMSIGADEQTDPNGVTA